jgi:hypothetical protein
MKNILKIIGFIAFAAIIGFPMVSCGDDSVVVIGGVLNMENLEKYNGKFVTAFGATGEGLQLVAAIKVNAKDRTGTGAEIKNGRATLSVWKVEGDENNPAVTAYKGNDTLTFTVLITDVKSVNFNDYPGNGEVGSAITTFKDGIGGGVFVPIEIPDINSGKLELTGLGKYNDKYIVAWTEDDSLSLIAANTVNAANKTGTGVKISAGKVLLNVWEIGGTESNPTTTAYKGNDTVTFTVGIFDNANLNFSEDISGGEGGMAIAKFQSGIGAGIFVPNIDIPDNSGGMLTLTGLGEYNEKYIIAFGVDDNNLLMLAAASSVNDGDQTAVGVKVDNGKAVLNVWEVTGDDQSGYTTTSYKGNDKVTFSVGIYSKETVEYGEEADEDKDGKAIAKFKFGIGAGVFYIGPDEPEEPKPVETSFDISVPSALVGKWQGDDTNGALTFTSSKISTSDAFTTKAYAFIVKIKNANNAAADTTVSINSNGSITTIVGGIAYVNLYSWKINGTTLTIIENKNKTTVFTGTKQ